MTTSHQPQDRYWEGDLGWGSRGLGALESEGRCWLALQPGSYESSAPQGWGACMPWRGPGRGVWVGRQSGRAGRQCFHCCSVAGQRLAASAADSVGIKLGSASRSKAHWENCPLQPAQLSRAPGAWDLPQVPSGALLYREREREAVLNARSPRGQALESDPRCEARPGARSSLLLPP